MDTIDAAQDGHFTNDKSYQPDECLCVDIKVENVGNQPNISDADSTEQFRTQSIPHYPGNPCAKGSNY